ncbi:MAG: M28 family peptidase [Myxococcales bacterium]|nr:M28 family peptidase [Myxococcales bacterium]
MERMVKIHTVKSGAGRVCLGFSLAVCLLLTGCQSTGSGSTRGDVPGWQGSNASGAQFFAPAAWRHMRALNKIGSRVSGSEGSAQFRKYLRSSLSEFEIELKEREVSVADNAGKSFKLTHLTAVIPGHSRDVLLLAAHYDTSPEALSAPSLNDQRASGAALLLELARVLAAGTTPSYTIWLSWIDGDALEASPGTPSQARLGSQSLLEEWIVEQEFSRIRSAIFFGNVGERDRPVVRDINSPRIYREIFWESAHDLGYVETFPADSHYEELETGRKIFAEASLRASIALANQQCSQAEAPVAASRSEIGGQPRRLSAGFEAVGNVTLEALARIAGRLQKIDHFAQSPLTAGREISP